MPSGPDLERRAGTPSQDIAATPRRPAGSIHLSDRAAGLSRRPVRRREL